MQDFQGMKSISLMFTGSYEVEPEVPGVAELVAWAATQAPSQCAAPGVQEVQGAVVTLAQVQEMVVAGRGEGRYLVAAMASRINSDTLFYRAGAGRRCRRRLARRAPSPAAVDPRPSQPPVPSSATW